MNTTDVIRYWKDPEYQESISEERKAAAPVSPAGLTELEDAELEAVTGGSGIIITNPRS